MIDEWFVYVLTSDSKCVYKIGYSHCPEERLRIFQTYNPFLRIVGTIKFDDSNSAREHERKLHKRYKNYRAIKDRRVEWYLLPNELANELLKSLNPWTGETL